MTVEQDLDWISNFIWGIADDVLRDLFQRGKYRDVILPMTVLQRLDSALQPRKAEVLKMKENLDQSGVVNQEAALRKTAGFPFYNTSKFSLKDLKNRGNIQQLRLDFEDWLDGFSSNVQDILENFEFRNQVPRLSKADALGTLIEKFLDPNLKLALLDNHAMGTVFEELVRRFNEDNNEEAGEHWTPRDIVKLMANLIFTPVASQIESGTYLLYDGVIGTGGMLTVAEETLRDLATAHGKQISTHLYGQEINPETYAICKSDMLLSGKGEEADNIVGGAEWSTLSNDAFRGRTFDFMLSNPPYGKSWKNDLDRMGGKKGITDPRFVVTHADDPEYSLVTRSNDGQMLFLANMASKMKHDTVLGSRIAEVHSGSSLFTGDAGQGESNARRWIVENDWLDAIIRLPERIFYNTGITTYIWVLTNRKPDNRKGRVQLIDASELSTPLRRNLGAKSCLLSQEDIERIISAYLTFEESDISKVLDNDAFGYRKVKVERPLRLHSQLRQDLIEGLRFASGDATMRREIFDMYGESLVEDYLSVREKVVSYLDAYGEDEEAATIPAPVRKRLLDEKRWLRDHKIYEIALSLAEDMSSKVFHDHNEFAEGVDAVLKARNVKLNAADKKALLRGLSWRDESAPPVVKRISKQNKIEPDPLFGRYAQDLDGTSVTIEFEADGDLSDYEEIPLTEAGGVKSFVEREVLPYTKDAWVDEKSEKIGYQISFLREFYRPIALRSLGEIRKDITELLARSETLVLEAFGEDS